jgi:hypothetical protein
MKKLTFLLLLCSLINCSAQSLFYKTTEAEQKKLNKTWIGQIIDSEIVFYQIADSSLKKHIPIIGFGKEPEIINSVDRVESKYDTIPVVLLISDTSSVLNNPVEWIYGYSVREYRYFLDGYYSENYWRHLFYLDSEKKLLENIIIWQSIKKK